MKISNKMSIIGSALFLSVTVCLFAPFEIYVANKSEFWFKLSAFWWIPILISAITFACCYIIGNVLRGKLQQTYNAFIFSLGLCAYLQGNFLNLNVGVLNGASIEWGEYTSWMCINLIVWIAVVIVIVIISMFKERYFKKAIAVVSFFLSSVQVVTLFVLLGTLVAEGGFAYNTYTFLSDERLYSVAEGENIIVFCLDMYDDTYFETIVEREPEVIEELEGFTYFSNFTGAYSTTTYALPHLFTGQIYRNEGSLNEWNNKVAEQGTYVDEFVNAGYQLEIYSTGHTVIPSKYTQNAINYVKAPLYITNYLHFSYDLYQLVACKYLPDILKPYIWMDGTEFDYWKGYKSDNAPYDGTNASFREGLLENGISVSDSSKLFKFIHINGSHYPYDIDENANDVEPDSVTDVQCARGTLRMVQWYLDELKKNDKYDDSLIVITADHGYYWDGVLTSPVCLIKPPQATGELEINSAPVCQADLPATLVELAGVETSNDFGKTIFEYQENEERDRLFYQYYLAETDNSWKWRLIEYKVDNADNSEEHFHLSGVEYTVNGTKIEHEKYCKTCQGEYANEEDALKEPLRVVHVKKENYPE